MCLSEGDLVMTRYIFTATAIICYLTFELKRVNAQSSIDSRKVWLIEVCLDDDDDDDGDDDDEVQKVKNEGQLESVKKAYYAHLL